MSEGSGSERVNQLIKEEISQSPPAVQIKDPRLGFVTVTEVDTTADPTGPGLCLRPRARGAVGQVVQGLERPAAVWNWLRKHLVCA